jgi:hypothetical protein
MCLERISRSSCCTRASCSPGDTCATGGYPQLRSIQVHSGSAEGAGPALHPVIGLLDAEMSMFVLTRILTVSCQNRYAEL